MKLTLKKSVFQNEGQTLQKATPLFVHFFMIVSVGAYAIFGALVMRNLESKTVTTIATKESIQQSAHIFLPGQHNTTRRVDLRHRRRRRYNETSENGFEAKLESRVKRAAAHVMRSRKCVINIIKRMSTVECAVDQLDETLVKSLDECYHVAIEHNSHLNHVLYANSREEIESVGEDSEEEVVEWSFMDSLLFAFTVITTIGYGNVAPRTFGGRLFVIGYGLVGIPFTLLAIADLGKFISEMMVLTKKSLKKTWKIVNEVWYPKTIFSRYPKVIVGKTIPEADIEEQILDQDFGNVEPPEDDEDLTETEATSLFLLFLVYLAFGGIMLAAYEPDMDFFKAVYFNFVTLTSIGLGDIVPRSETYMLITIIYIAVGLALTTIAIEIAADALKKLHYFGRKIENVGNVAIWFGGKKITMKALVKNLGDQFNLPSTVVKSLNLDTFVEQAIKVEEGEIETLRPPPFEPSPEKFDAEFADEPEIEWIRAPTPSSSSPSMSPELVHRQSFSSKRHVVPEKMPSPSPSVSSLAVATPSPDESEDEELVLPSSASSPIRELTPTPRNENEPHVSDSTPEETIPVQASEPIQKTRPLTAAEIAAQKRKAYSEEAWRRYQEYQKQWKKFRQTQKTPVSGQIPSSSTSSTSQVAKNSGISPEDTRSSTRSQSISSAASGRTSRAATPESKKSSHPSKLSKGEEKLK